MLDDTLSWLSLFIAEALDDLDGRFIGFGGCFGSDEHGHERVSLVMDVYVLDKI